MKSERLRAEKDMLGLYVSDHPLMGVEHALRRLVDCSIADLNELDDGVMRTVAGVVTAFQRKYTKRGDLMATFVLEDLAASIEVMVFPKTMLTYGELLASDAIVTIRGRVDGRDDTPKLMAMEITRPELHVDSGPPVRLRVKAAALTDERVQRLRELLAENPGDSPVLLTLLGPDKETDLRLGDEFRCEAHNTLFAELRILFGAEMHRPIPGNRGPGREFVLQLVFPDAYRNPGGDGSCGRRAGRPARERRARGVVRFAGGRQGAYARSTSSRSNGATASRVDSSRATTRGRATRRWCCSQCTRSPRSRPCRSTPIAYAGKIVVSMANNLVKHGNEFNAVLPPHGSVAAEIQALLWRSRVCTAFHLVPAAEFGEIDHEMSSDVIVLGDDDDAKSTVMEITEQHPAAAPARRRFAAQRGRDGDVRGGAVDGQHPAQDARRACASRMCRRGPGRSGVAVDPGIG